jgi:hypothetical protein
MALNNAALAAKTVTGGRAVVLSDGIPVGIFDSVTLNESLTLEDIHTLGKFSAQEIVMTSYESVKINVSGFRVYGSGVKKLGQFPTLADLLNLGTITLAVQDRQNPAGAPLATVVNCVLETNNVNYNARATSKVNLTYRGTILTDESTVGDGETGATTFP